MPCAAVFRLQANTCLHLANNATEFWIAASLRELADDLLARADRAAKHASAGPSLPRTTFERERRDGT